MNIKGSKTIAAGKVLHALSLHNKPLPHAKGTNDHCSSDQDIVQLQMTQIGGICTTQSTNDN